MAEVGKLSASKITTYKGCSFAYFLNYVQHERVPSNFRLVADKGIHYMLDKFYKVNYKSPESFGRFWNWYWFREVAGEGIKGKAREKLEIEEVKYMGKNKETGKREEKIIRIGNHINFGMGDPEMKKGIVFGYMKMGNSMLQDFHRRMRKKTVIDGIEKEITITPLCHEQGFGVKKADNIEIAGHSVRGVFDRIDEKNGKYWIADYKTDKHSPQENSFVLHRNIQFTLYSNVFRQIYGKEEDAILYYHLRSDTLLKTHRSEKDYDYLKHILDEVADGITQNKFTPFYGFHCNFCDLKTACEKYSIKHHGGPRLDLDNKIMSAERFTEWDEDVPEEADWTLAGVEER